MPGNHLFYAVINTAGDIYICIRDHQSLLANEPGFGPNWPLYWRLDNSYAGLAGVWVGPLISVHYRPPALVTLFLQNRQNDAHIVGWKRRRRQFYREVPYFFAPPKLLNVTTKRMFESTTAPRDDLGGMAAARLRRHRGYSAGVHEESYFAAPRGMRAIPWFPRMQDAPRRRRAMPRRDESIFVSWVHIKGRPPWMGTTVDSGHCGAMMAGAARKARHAMIAEPLAGGGIPKYGDKTVTRELSFNVAGV